MGGGIALQLALRHPTKIAAAFVLSSFMCDNAAAYQLLENAPSSTAQLLRIVDQLAVNFEGNSSNQLPEVRLVFVLGRTVPILMMHGEALRILPT